MNGKVLLVGEIISNGGLGLQGDIITVTSLGGKPILAVTIMSTIRNPLNRSFQTVDLDYIIQQIKDARERPGINCIKIGALASDSMVLGVSDYIKNNKISEPIVYCPILVSNMGAPLLDISGIQMIQKYLIPQSSILILNMYDAEILTGITIPGVEQMEEAAKVLLSFGAKAVLITGGLLDGLDLCDVYADKNGTKVMKLPKHEPHIQNNFRFGGAWILATATATGLAQGYTMIDAINRGRQYVDQAIKNASMSDDNYQNLFLTHTIKTFEYQRDKPSYEVVKNS